MTWGSELLATEYGKTGLEFAQALASGSYEAAHELLSNEAKGIWPAPKLRDTFQQMIQHGVVTEVEAMEGYNDYPDKQAADIGGVYVSISGHQANDPLMTYNEAVLVFVTREPSGPRVREIIWGRP